MSVDDFAGRSASSGLHEAPGINHEIRSSVSGITLPSTTSEVTLVDVVHCPFQVSVDDFAGAVHHTKPPASTAKLLINIRHFSSLNEV